VINFKALLNLRGITTLRRTEESLKLVRYLEMADSSEFTIIAQYAIKLYYMLLFLNLYVGPLKAWSPTETLSVLLAPRKQTGFMKR